MSSREVTEDEVLGLIPNTQLTNLIPFIAAANSLVDRLAASECGADLSESDLVEVEKWLAAHFASVADPSVAIESQKVEGSTVKASRGNVASHSGIMSTQFGQMANTLSGGCLQELDKRKPTLVFA